MSRPRAPFTDSDPRHGTYAGVQAHTLHKTPYCAECREARRLYIRQYRLSRSTGRLVAFPLGAPLEDFNGLGATIARSWRESA